MSNITKTTVTVYPPDEENFLQEPRIGEFFLTFVKDQKLGAVDQPSAQANCLLLQPDKQSLYNYCLKQAQ